MKNEIVFASALGWEYFPAAFEALKYYWNKIKG